MNPIEAVKSLSENKRKWNSFEEHEQKKYAPYIINRWVSFSSYYDKNQIEFNLDVANIVQKYLGLIPNKAHYDIFYSLLPKKRLYTKYIKGQEQEKINKELISIFTKFFQISSKEAKENIELLLEDRKGINYICSLLQAYGYSDKEIKKIIKNKKEDDKTTE